MNLFPIILDTPIKKKWTPNTLGAAFLSEMDPGRSDLLTLVSGKVSALVDTKVGTGVSWVQTTAGNRPVYTASGTGGKACLSTANATSTKLYCATGGVTGNVAHEVWALAEMFPNPATVGSMVGLGSQNNSSIIGTWLNGSTAFWGGGIVASGSGALPSGPGDTGLHVFRKQWDGSSTGTLWVDGQLLGGVAGATYNLTAGSGCFLYGNGHQIADANLYIADFFSGNLTRGPGQSAWLMDQYLLRKNASVAKPVYGACIGDSLVHPASGLTTAQMWPAVLQVDLQSSPYSIPTASVGNMGGAGTVTSQCLSTALSSTTNFWSPIWTKRFIAILIGTNDCGNLVTGPTGPGGPAAIAATALSNIAAMVTTLVTAGYATKAIICTIPARADAAWNSDKETCRLTINAGILAMSGVTTIDLASHSQFQNPSDTTYYQADKIHMTATGAALIAQLVAVGV